MKTTIILTIGFVLNMILTTEARSAVATNAVAAHNALHYVEDLVDENKVGPDFMTKLKALSVAPIKQGTVVIGFRAVLEQVPGTDGTAMKVEIQLDAAGRALSFTAVNGSAAANAPIWPKDDSITLMEEALHHIAHNATNPDIAPFSADLAAISLSQEVLPDHTITAVVDAQLPTPGKLLRIILNTDGTVRSSQVINTVKDNPISQLELVSITRMAIEDYTTQNPELISKITGFKVTTTGQDGKVLIYVDHDGMIMQGNYLCVRQIDNTFVCTGH